MGNKKAFEAVKNAVEVITTVKPDMEKLLGIQAEMMWTYYNQLKTERFTEAHHFNSWALRSRW